MAMRINVLVARNHSDADRVKSRFPQYRLHVVVTPKTETCEGFVIGEYLWTPMASELPPRVRLALRGKLRPMMSCESIEEEFPDTLLSW
jgi:hypothetical protein